MATAEVLLAQIAARVRGGTYDDELDELGVAIRGIAEAMKSRRRDLAKQQVTELREFDRVMIHGLRSSSGLNGVIATVVEPLRTRVKVRIPEDAPRHAGQVVTVPGSCLDLGLGE